MANGLPIEEIRYYFFPFEDGEWEGRFNKGLNNGWKYIMENRDRWVESPLFTNISQCHSQGSDFIIYKNKCYFFDRTYHIIDSTPTGSTPTIIITGKLSKNMADQIDDK